MTQDKCPMCGEALKYSYDGRYKGYSVVWIEYVCGARLKIFFPEDEIVWLMECPNFKP